MAGFPEVVEGIGRALSVGDVATALGLARQAVADRPGDAHALTILATTNAMAGNHDEAIANFQAVLEKSPHHAVVRDSLAVVLRQAERLEEALHHHAIACRDDPQNPVSRMNYGATLAAAGDHEEAIQKYDEALRLNPGLSAARSNRGNALRALRRYEEAEAEFRRLVDLPPPSPGAWTGLATVLSEAGRVDEARSAFEAAIRLKPGFSNAIFGQALLDLRAGRPAWKGWERRWTFDGHPARRYAGERDLALSEVEGKRVLIWPEQGFGDNIQFSRYIPILTDLGAIVQIEARSPLVRLFRSSFPNLDVVTEPGPFDMQCPVASLPLHLFERAGFMTAAVPYLRAEPNLTREWSEKLSESLAQHRPRIALACSGNARLDRRNGMKRPVPLRLLEPLCQFAEVLVVQRDLSDADRRHLNHGSAMRFIGESLGDFADTAAVLASCDFVVSVDTALAHLAGAMARPLFVLLSWNADWRWLSDRDDSPWYPSARLFRQEAAGDWSRPIVRLIETLTDPSQAPPWSVPVLTSAE